MSNQGFHVLEELKFTRNASFAIGYGDEVGDGEVWAVSERWGGEEKVKKMMDIVSEDDDYVWWEERTTVMMMRREEKVRLWWWWEKWNRQKREVRVKVRRVGGDGEVGEWEWVGVISWR